MLAASPNEGRIFGINLFQSSIVFLIETNHLTCTANQITGFYMKCNTLLKCINIFLNLSKTAKKKTNNLVKPGKTRQTNSKIMKLYDLYFIWAQPI